MANGSGQKPYSARRWWEPIPIKTFRCQYCENRIPYTPGDAMPKCLAYPEGIPLSVLERDENNADPCGPGVYFRKRKKPEE